MLHKNPLIIAPHTFQLIQQLQSLPELADFYLVGGTSLALQLGHRNSIDIDLFTQIDFEDNVSSINKCNTRFSSFLFGYPKRKDETENRNLCCNVKKLFPAHPCSKVSN